ncbi:MAG: lytic transglycosylase domain-containing protein [Pyrinomonadaceae bacterium]
MALASAAVADRIHLTDGKVIEVDSAWEDNQEVWYRRGNLTQSIERVRVRRIERSSRAVETASANASSNVTVAPGNLLERGSESNSTKPQTTFQSVWIHLAGGARVEADSASETADGLWYKRAGLTIFIPSSRVKRIERAASESLVASVSSMANLTRSRGWTTGSARIDELIKQNAALYGVDPYLIFCVMEQESQFNARALSPKGARGLMQLMPGTAARFGVRKISDPAENIRGGTRYLRELLTMFGGKVDLVLAGYNAGEGAVMRYGHRVPPYRETRNYVQRISTRYGRTDTTRNVANDPATTPNAPK